MEEQQTFGMLVQGLVTLASVLLLVSPTYSRLVNDSVFDLCAEDSGCICVDSQFQTSIHCEGGRIKETPGPLPSKISVPPNYASVDFSNSGIPFILSDTFDGTYVATSVVKLDFSSNDIEFVQDGAFEMFRSLRELVLRRNKIANLTLAIFHGLTQLESLDLSYNNIAIVDIDVLYPCTALRQLSLRYNPLPLMAVQDLLSSASANLEELDLHGLGLDTLSQDLFRPVPYTQKIILSANRLVQVPGEALNRLNRLLVLDLSDNMLTEVRDIDFQGLESLEELFLDQMRHLERVHEGSFKTLHNLRVFSCSFNPGLSVVQAGAFPVLQNNKTWRLEELHLRQNALMSLDEMLLPWDLVRYVDLSENPWICDCKLAWMKRIHWDLRRVPPIACNMPRTLRRRLIVEVPLNSFVCEVGVEGHLLASLVLLFATVLLLAFVFFLFTCWKLSWCLVCRASFQRRYVKLKTLRNNNDSSVADVEMQQTSDKT